MGNRTGGGGTMFRSGTRLFFAFLNRNGTRLFEIWGKYKLCPLLNFGPTAGRGQDDNPRCPKQWAGAILAACMCAQAAIVYEYFSEAVVWRLDEATNLPRFRPLDVGPVGFTGRSYQKSNFLVLPNIGLTRFWASRGFFGASFEILKQKHSHLEYS